MNFFQKHPLAVSGIALIVGILGSAVVASPSIWVILPGLALLLGAWQISNRLRAAYRLRVALSWTPAVCFVACGWLLGTQSAIIPASDPSKFIGHRVEVEGTVVDDVRTSQYGHKTVLEISEPMQGRVVLQLPAEQAAPATNDILRGTIVLKEHSTRNPGYANWLHHQGIHASAKGSDMQKVGEATGLIASLKGIRSDLAAAFASRFVDPALSGLCNAMLLGDRTHLDSDVRTDFSATGLSHIVAISGMNFAIIYGVLVVLLQPLLRLRNGRRIRSLVIVPFLFFFALLTGANPAVIRAAFMLSLLDLSQAFHSKSNSLNALAASALVFLTIDPQSLFTPDFQLSYAAVAGILLFQNPILHYLHRRLPKLPRLLASPMAVTLAAQLATTPLVAWHFHSFPTYFLLANIVVLPFVTLVVQIGFAGFLVAWIPGLGDAWGGVMDFLLWTITSLAHLMAELPGATITAIQTTETGLWIMMAQVVLGLIVLEKRFFARSIALLRSNAARPLAHAAVAGIRRRIAVAGSLLIWVMVGFFLG
ncbi:MAG: ComEC/Rec2 family competence protein [Bacteroidia bacterium]